MKRLALLVVPAIALMGLAAPASAMKDYARTAFGIVPSGQYGAVPTPPEASDQALMYDALTPLFDQVKPSDLPRTFKSERLGTARAGPADARARAAQGRLDPLRPPPRAAHQRQDRRRRHLGAGWVLAKDRELLLEQARYNSRVAVGRRARPGGDRPVTSLRSFVPSAQTEREVAERGQAAARLRQARPAPAARHRRLRRPASTPTTAPRRRPTSPGRARDVIALNAIKSELFGEGGGQRGAQLDVPQRAAGLARRRARASRSSTTCASARTRRRPSRSPAASRTRRCPSDRTGNVIVDNGSFSAGRRSPARPPAAGVRPRRTPATC